MLSRRAGRSLPVGPQDRKAWRRRIEIPGHWPWFEGHFVGTPILPGIAQVALVVEALAEISGAPVVLSGIRSLRLRRIVRPGDVIELALEPSPDGTSVRFELTSGGETASTGALTISPAGGALG